jgi:uncharacterized protein YndB with AHSA1/START domain
MSAIVKELTIAATPERIFKALTEPDDLAKEKGTLRVPPSL